MWRLRISLSSVLGGLCGLLGLATASVVVGVCLDRGLAASTPLAIAQLGAAVLLAVLVGNVVRECAFALSEALVTACGRPFFRKTRTVTGRLVSEVWLPGGMWVRCETWKDGAALAWTERDGSCTGIEMPAMQVARAEPPRASKTTYSRDQLQGLLQSAALSAGRLQARALQEATRTRLPAAPATAAGRGGSKAEHRHALGHRMTY